MHAWASSHSISLAETLENVFNGMFRCLVTERKQHRDFLRHLGAVVPEIDAISARQRHELPPLSVACEQQFNGKGSSWRSR